MGFGIPSFSDIKNAVTSTVSSATNTVTGAAGNVRDFGSAALDRTRQLASDGVDLGRRAVNAVRSVDVREAAAVVRQKIGEGTEAAREGIKTGVEYAGQRTGDAADFARAHVPGGDNVVSNGIRGAITVAESSTRFQLGVVGGVSREVVGLAGTVGQLGTTAVEMRLSPEASAEYGQKIVDGAKGAVEATGNYIESAANDPSRVGRDLSSAADAGGQWVDGQINRYEQSFREGKGFETVGMDVGTVATYVVPVGGGPARGALTAAARGGTEAVARGGVEVAARGGVEALAREGGEAVVRGGTQAAARVEGQVAARTSVEAATVGRSAAATNAGEVATGAARRGDDYGVAFFGKDNLKYYQVENATLGREGGAYFHMPIADSVLVTDAASAARYTGHAPSALEAYKTGGEIYGISFPRAGLGARVPTAADAGGYAHFLEGGHTAVRTAEPNAGFLVNPTREFVIPGGQAVPAGSTLFRLDGGAWTPIKQF